MMRLYTNMERGLYNYTLTRAPTGLDIRPPEGFYVDNGKTVARSAAKIGTTIPLSFLHIVCQF